jgi:GAF domain-containing protein
VGALNQELSAAGARIDRIAADLLVASRDPEWMNVVVERAVDALGGYGGLLCTVDRGKLRVRSARGYAPSVVNAYSVMDLDAPTPACIAVRTGRPFVVSSLAEYAKTFAQFRASTELPTRAFAYVPVRSSRGEVIGTIGVSFDVEREADATDLAVLNALARYAANSLTRP